MPTRKIPPQEISPEENVRMFFEPLKWHPDLIADLRQCHADLCCIAAAAGPGVCQSPQRRCRDGILNRYRKIWDKAPAVGEWLGRGIDIAITSGNWSAAMPVLRTVTGAYAQSRWPRVMADTFADARRVRWLAQQDSDSLWSVHPDLEADDRSELVGVPLDSTPYPAIVLHAFPGAKRQDFMAAIDRVLPNLTLTPAPSARSSDDGRPLDMVGHVALYRLWWEWRKARERQGEPATTYAFVRRRGWSSLPPELVAELTPHIQWFVKLTITNKENRLRYLEKWLPPDPSAPPMHRLSMVP